MSFLYSDQRSQFPVLLHHHFGTYSTLPSILIFQMFHLLPAGRKTFDGLKTAVKQCFKERDIDLYEQEAQELIVSCSEWLVHYGTL
jgi:hypothetical protein